MKQILTLAVVFILLAGCVSNKPFQEQKQKVLQLERSFDEQNTELIVLRKEIMQSRRSTGYSTVTIDSLFAEVKAMSEFQNTNFQQVNDDVAYLLETVADMAQEQKSMRDDFVNLQADNDDILEGFADRIGANTNNNTATPAVSQDIAQLTKSVGASNKALKEQIATLEKNIADLRTSMGKESSSTGTTEYSGSIETLRKRIDELETKQKAVNATNKAELERLQQKVETLPSAKQKAEVNKTISNTKEGEIPEYEAARKQYDKGNHKLSRELLADFIGKYPNSDYLGNALYWTGENYYAEGDFTNALREFQNVVSRYPDSWKAADSQLKVGLCYWYMGNPDAGRQEIESIRTAYPKYRRMDLVDKFLKQIK
ncbi:MAG: tol-pal system protein YbgF [Candidatus Cloacimonetes bacterium]|nr:tol-pal system protein YbgF [Candidatus Cloacimonadota bacterium]